MAGSGWMERLRQRWKLNSLWQVVIVLVVFACTGFTVLFIKRPILSFLAGEEGSSTTATVLYYIFILPLYNLLLLAYGFVFGQFEFFWKFEARFFNRLLSGFKSKRKP